MKYDHSERMRTTHAILSAMAQQSISDMGIVNVRAIKAGNKAMSASDAMSKEFNFQELTMLSLNPIFRRIHRWWLKRAERHYLICADIEERRVREAQSNVAYYQRQAALARSARMM